jgi:hypothetical protein
VRCRDSRLARAGVERIVFLEEYAADYGDALRRQYEELAFLSDGDPTRFDVFGGVPAEKRSARPA